MQIQFWRGQKKCALRALLRPDLRWFIAVEKET
jgi:hypothetical protein